jgi:hypothetical protein
MKIIVTLLFIAMSTPLVQMTGVVASSSATVRFLDEEPSECEVATENVTSTDSYSELSDIIEEDIYSILNNSRPEVNLCQEQKQDGYLMCSGALSPLTLASYNNLCTASNGQIVTLENVRVTCNPSSSDENDQTYTVIEEIPVCIGAVCSDDDADDAVSDKLKSLGKMGVKLNGVAGSCKALEGTKSSATLWSASGFMMVTCATASWLLL